MNKNYSIFLRYLFILVLGLGNLVVFYNVFTLPTKSLVILFLKPFFSVITSGQILTIGTNISIELIPACIAGAAYYLLFILVLSTPKIKVSKRLLILAFSSAVFLLINSLRIVFLIFINNTSYFNSLHFIFWYILSTIFVVGIWFIDVKLFKIKSIPLYSDIIGLYKNVNNK
jgi:exosortase/archaeosortase family protein